MIDLKRVTDVVIATVALIVAAPMLAVAALGIRLSSPGPILYRARRAGRYGRPFTMLKLRTMHAHPAGRGSPITGVGDPRVYPLGRLLRATKIDELPQLVNILRGEMSLVGPRPEDPELVARCYAPLHRETLAVRPGLSSPGSLYHDTHGERLLAGGDAEARYVSTLLPVKLAIDLVYVRRAGPVYDLAIMGRTVAIICGRLLGRREFPEPPELADAAALVVPARAESRAITMTRPMPPAETPAALRVRAGGAR
jgi:lipopolysaccharide/colanic/teichoic acid biosynthesis glycosyltransferase